ncbi:proprotein convertase P-domain-containing protein, partial [Pseudonocardia sp. KRD-188]
APDPNTPLAQGTSAGPLVIPDDTAGGATSTITLDGGDARVGRLEVVLDLQHAYPAEVTGVLTSPAGRQAVVFPRAPTGGRLTLSTTDPASPLVNLLGGPVAGDWALTLSDEVTADSGTLTSWGVTAYPAAPDAPAPAAAPATASATPGLAIPDDDDYVGATDVLGLSGYGTVDRIAVDVAVSHAISSDLRIELRSPLGRTVVLSEYEAGLGPAIALTLDSATPGSPLAPLVGEPLAGPWELRVYDGVIVDEGTFDRWGVTVNG